MKRIMSALGTRPHRWLCRLAIVPPVLLVACLWADSVLKVADRGADLVMTSDDLKSFLEEEEQPVLEEKGEQPAQQPMPEEEQTANNNVAEESTKETAPQPTVQPSAMEESTVNVTDAETDEPGPVPEQSANTEETVASVVETPMQSPSSEDFAEASGGEATSDLSLTTGQPGNLASFAAAGAQGVGQDKGDGSSTKAGMVWDVELAGHLSVEDLQAGRGVLLAAVRQRHDYVEIALTAGNDVLRPLSLEQFLNKHPSFSGRHGIILDRRWLRPFNERLLSRGGGWEMWLLLNDELFAKWIANVEREVGDRGWLFSDIEQIQAVVSFAPTKDAQLDIRKLHRRKKVPVETSDGVPLESK